MTRTSTWWNRPGMSFTDSGLSGGTHTYRVRAADRFGNAVTSPPVTITIAGPPNASPVADFTSSLVDRTLDVDAGGSSDSDGTITSYSWDWGDGQTGSGVVAQHVYAADGTYVVRLTVVDDDGASATSTETVVVGDPATGVVASDTFDRTVDAGLGSAGTGGPWSVTGLVSRFSVDGSEGVVTITGAGTGPSAYLPGTSADSVDLTTGIRLDKLANGGGVFFGTIGRKVGAAEYRLKLKVTSDGAVTAYVTRLSGAEATLQSMVVPGLTYQAGDRLNTRLQVIGANPSTVRARVWLSTSAEPAGWQVSATDATAALQTAGSVGLHTYISGSATNAAWAIRFDDFLATAG